MKGGFRFFNSLPLSGGAFFLPKNPSLRSEFLGFRQGACPLHPLLQLNTAVSITRSATAEAVISNK